MKDELNRSEWHAKVGPPFTRLPKPRFTALLLYTNHQTASLPSASWNRKKCALKGIGASTRNSARDTTATMGSNSSRIEQDHNIEEIHSSRPSSPIIHHCDDSDLARIPELLLNNAVNTSDSLDYPTTLLDLPPEIQLRVLLMLPARDVQKCRRISRHFHELIDAPENHSLFLKPGINYALRRLNDSIATFCHYPTHEFAKDGTPTSFLRALGFFFDNALHNDDFHEDWDDEDIEKYNWFGKMFWDHWHASANPQDIPLLGEELETLWPITLHFYAAASYESDPWTPKENWTYDQTKLLLYHMDTAHYLFGATTAEQILKMFGAAEKNELEGRPICHFAPQPPKYRLVRVPTTGKYEDDGKYSQRRQAMVSKLVDLLHVPSLPYTAPVTYCTKSRWAWILIKLALEDGEVLSPIKRAALLEELIIG